MPPTEDGTGGQQPRDRERDAEAERDHEANDRRGEESDASDPFTGTAIQAGLVGLVVVLLLFVIGASSGFPIFGAVAEAVGSEAGQWVVVGVVAVILIAAAERVLPTG